MRPHFIDHLDQRELIQEVTGLEVDAVEQVFDAPVIRGAGSADQSVDLVAFLEEQLREIRTILAGNSCNKSALGHGHVRLAGNSGARPTRALRTPLAAADGVIIQRGRPGTASLSFLPDFLAALQFLRGFCKSAQARAHPAFVDPFFQACFCSARGTLSSGICVAFDEDDSSRSLMLKPRLGVAVLLTVLLSAATANAAAISLTWDRNAESTVTGYVVQVGSTPGGTDQAIDIGNQISWTFGWRLPARRITFACWRTTPPARAACPRTRCRAQLRFRPTCRLREFRYADRQRNGVDGSVAVTGWALDDNGVTKVQILRAPVAGEAPGTPVYIGDASRVPGARPDIAAKYPTAAQKDRAGWGYLLLSLFLPNLGQGTFRSMPTQTMATGIRLARHQDDYLCQLHFYPSVRRDRYAGQGEVVSGVVNNFGWVLAPKGQPTTGRRADPAGGGTVRVVIDGVPVGSPTGWTSRSDLTSLFPTTRYNGVGTMLGCIHVRQPDPDQRHPYHRLGRD